MSDSACVARLRRRRGAREQNSRRQSGSGPGLHGRLEPWVSLSAVTLLGSWRCNTLEVSFHNVRIVLNDIKLLYKRYKTTGWCYMTCRVLQRHCYKLLVYIVNSMHHKLCIPRLFCSSTGIDGSCLSVTDLFNKSIYVFLGTVSVLIDLLSHNNTIFDKHYRSYA